MKTMKEEREILRQQIKLLAEMSRNGYIDDGPSRYSHEMMEIYKALKFPVSAMIFCFVIVNFFVCFVVFIKKFGRGKI